MTWVLALVALGAAALGLVYLALALVLVFRLARLQTARSASYPSVTVLKPLHGAEAGLFESLSSFCAQDYPGPVQIVCGVQSAGDPAVTVVREVERAFPELQLDLVVDPRQHGSNRKVSNLINMAAEIRHDVVVLADSDMRVAPDYLRRLAGELARPGVGAVTCLYHGIPLGGVWSRLSALSIDTHFLPSIAVGLGLGLAKPCFGSTIALTTATLEEIGGFRAVADDLADDYELGAAVRRLGLDVVVPPFAIGHVCAELSFGDLFRQELRWIRTIRQIEPAGHAGSILAHPLPLALLALCLAPGALTLASCGVAILARMALCLAVERSFGLRRHSYWLVPARDLLSFAVFVASFFGRDVSWRGHSYGVTPRGVLIPKAEP
ncbi:MAG TPA: bacteriohopanetetrol glucosamine biosynthesis glycosyltransferase HpnI [Enterovirga sp.]